MRSAGGSGSTSVVLHRDNEGEAVTVQLLVLWSATSIAAQRPPMEASGLEMCIAVEKSWHAEVLQAWRIFGPLKLGPTDVELTGDESMACSMQVVIYFQ